MNYTYAKLLDAASGYFERNDGKFIAEIPGFINLAENRLATDMKQQGFQTLISGKLEISHVLKKPAYWRETLSFVCTDAAGEQYPLQLRALEFVRAYWPNRANTGTPRYYADYNSTHFYIAATPAAAVDFELVYYARLQPLSNESQTNWLTDNAPQALLYAVLAEAGIWAGNDKKAQMYLAQYESAKAAFAQESQERLADRTAVVARG